MDRSGDGIGAGPYAPGHCRGGAHRPVGNGVGNGWWRIQAHGAAPTANYVQSSGWTPRLRQLWAQLDEPSGWTVMAGVEFSQDEVT